MLLAWTLREVRRCRVCRAAGFWRAAGSVVALQAPPCAFSRGLPHVVQKSRAFSTDFPHCKGRSDGGWDERGPIQWLSAEEEQEDEEEIEDLLVPHSASLLHGTQHVFIVHPDVKWGPKKHYATTADLQVAEAVALVHSLPNWTLVDKLIMSTKSPDSKLIFGKGNFQVLTEIIKGLPQITAVFVNVERLSPLTEKELEEAWRVKVFDRYKVVLNIFRYNARTREAKLQIALAELPLLRSSLKNEMAHLDQQGGGSRYIMGSGETFLEIQQRLLKERETKIKNALEKLRRTRNLLRTQRRRREFPIISVMGYTNCGKTTLIKALTGNIDLQPRDQLFATLDVTTHAGLLPCRMPVIYVDTIGFLSQLPHDLIASFSATLEDVVHSDLLIHVRDISHPEADNQKASVLSVLEKLNVPQQLLDTIIEIHNKIDLVENHNNTDSAAVPVSALLGYGLEDLKRKVEAAVMKSTGRTVLTIKVNLESPQLSWLYKEATVQELKVCPEDGTANVRVIITNAAYGRYIKLFCK
ncbi:putative GTP-binding protein 6 [Spea bombifrons]|uniref:putative GTP-binding protein 6 n=1 Tax=Spea bombifrons TaxID=233779 RepID=UPI002349218D|nr:putative GTP-binding protein 6 [Spea bombifrons]